MRIKDKMITPEIHAEQIRVVHSHLPALIRSNVLVMLLVWLVLHDSVSILQLWSWTVLLCLLITVRLIMCRAFQRQVRTNSDVLRWSRYPVIFALLSGIIWASLSPISAQADLIQFFTITGILVIMVTAALATGSSYRPSYLVFAIPVMLSFSTTMLLQGGEHRLILALICYSTLAVLIVFSRNIEHAFVESIRMRFEKQALAEQLSIQKQEAELANLAKSKFLAAASHDLRQPLHALSLYLDTLHTELNTNRQRELAQKMGIAIDALKDLFQRLLEISKLDAGIVEPNIGDHLVSELFSRMEVRFYPLAKTQGLQLQFNHHNEVLSTDPILLERILDNLIGNALRYTETGVISVGTINTRENIIIEVTDTGPGIPVTEQENIFNEFYQLHNPERDRSKGLGLGLSIVKRLCLLLNYPLELESAIGAGTKFRLHVPVGDIQKAVSAPEPQTRLRWDIDGTRILFIDDEADVRDAMYQLLTSWGSKAICVDSIKEALTAVRKGPTPDLIIADYRLRELQTGVDAIRTVTDALQANIPGILITGDTAPERLQEAGRSGFKLLHKPVNAGQLRVVVNYLLTQNQRQI
jgi:signal transduction histidine kinase/CheY-like chemotaxis protein